MGCWGENGGISWVSGLMGAHDVVFVEKQNHCDEVMTKYLKAQYMGGMGSIRSILPGTEEEGNRLIEFSQGVREVGELG